MTIWDRDGVVVIGKYSYSELYTILKKRKGFSEISHGGTGSVLPWRATQEQHYPPYASSMLQPPLRATPLRRTSFPSFWRSIVGRVCIVIHALSVLLLITEEVSTIMKLSFDASKVDPQVGLTVLPAGKYNVAIETCEKRANKDGEGEHLALMLNVLEGKYEGRKIFNNLNLWNESAKAKEFAQGTLSAVCHATGIMQLEDTDELIGIPMVADVRVTDQKVFGKSNVINAYRPVAEEGTSDSVENLI